MMKRYIYCICALLFCIACNKEDPNRIKPKSAPAFQGSIETSLEVDLGLKAKWAGYNLGAEKPSRHGSYYSWSETEVKDEYNEGNYSLSGTLVPGAQVEKGKDAATSLLGYGWITPSPEDWKELADNCTITMASYEGVTGYVATSKVPGYEGRSIFFPCAGYKAASNTNNVEYSAVYWSNSLVPDSGTHAINAFFTNGAKCDTLCLNTPPKGNGGLVWCGYPIRGIRKFTLEWDAEDVAVKREITSVKFNIFGNAKWAVSAGAGASCNPSSGEGDAVVTINIPVNDTYEAKTYKITLSSPEFTTTKSFEISQFGIIPDFAFSEEGTNVMWDEEIVGLTLNANSDVSWTGSIVDSAGAPVEGSSLNPVSGTGAASITATVPSSTNTKGESLYYVKLVTEDSRIPEEIRTITYEIRQAVCPFTPFGTIWGNSFMNAWSKFGFAAKVAFTAETATASTSSALSGAGGSGGYMKGQFNFQFTAAQTGTGVLHFTVLLGSAGHRFRVIITRNGTNVHQKEWSLGVTDRTTIDYEMEVQKGDIVTIAYQNGTSNARLYCANDYPISWIKKQ